MRLKQRIHGRDLASSQMTAQLRSRLPSLTSTSSNGLPSDWRTGSSRSMSLGSDSAALYTGAKAVMPLSSADGDRDAVRVSADLFSWAADVLMNWFGKW